MISYVRSLHMFWRCMLKDRLESLKVEENSDKKDETVVAWLKAFHVGVTVGELQREKDEIITDVMQKVAQALKEDKQELLRL